MMMIAKIKIRKRATNFKPTKNLKQLKNLLNIRSPNIKYS